MNNNDFNRLNRQELEDMLHSRNRLINSRIREPVSGIFALLPLIADNINKSDGDKALFHLETVSQQTYSLLRNVTNISLTTRILSGSMPRTQKVNFSTLLESIVSGVRTVVNNICIETDIDRDIFVTGNRDFLSNAVLNLISNSLSFCADEAVKITVQLKSDGKTAVFSYRDNSKGIKDIYLEDIFKPYFSQDPFDDSEPAPSLGLGLYITKTAFEQTGAKLLATSAFGEGIRYTAAVPVVIPDTDTLESRPADFLLNRYSNLFVQLCDHCNLPSLI